MTKKMTGKQKKRVQAIKEAMITARLKHDLDIRIYRRIMKRLILCLKKNMWTNQMRDYCYIYEGKFEPWQMFYKGGGVL